MKLEIPPVYFLSTGLAMLGLHRAMPIVQLLDWPWRWVGVLPILLGIALAIWGERQFKKAGTAVLPFSKPSALVTTGPFVFTRNPMYLGMMLCLLGWFLALGSLGPILVIPAFALLIHHRFVVREEAFMEQHFGDSYIAYKSRVRRWL